MLPAVGGGGTATGTYQIVGQLSTIEVGPNGTTIPIEQITFRSTTYGVTATFNVLSTTYLARGADALVALKCTYVDNICAEPYVIFARGEQDVNQSGNVYNYLVVTVGTPDGSRQTDVAIRMDALGSGADVSLVQSTYDTMLALGPIVAQPIYQ
jgi:hypothetical protein